MMLNLLKIITVIFLLVSCGNPTPKNNIYVSKDGGFEIEFPGTFVTVEEKESTIFGDVKWTTSKCEMENDDNLYYSVSYCDIPKNKIHSDSLNLLQEFFFLTQRDFGVKYGEAGLTQLNYRKINDYPGREFLWMNTQHTIGFHRQMYLVKNRLYKIETSYKMGKVHNMKAKDFEKSFKLLDKTRNAHPEAELKAPEKRYTVEFPGKSIHQDQQLMSAFGPTMVRMEALEIKKPTGDEHRNLAYMVMCMEVPKEQIEKATAQEKMEFLKMQLHQNPMVVSGGEVIEEKEDSYDGIPCLEGTVMIFNGAISYQSRSFFYQGYLYQIATMTMKGYENNAGTQKFRDSFRIVK